MKINEIEVKALPGLPDYFISRNGELWSEKSHSWLTPHLYKGGLCLKLRRGDGQVTHTVGRLVLEAWFGPCPEKMECCHNDGDTGHNALENLRWDTHQANIQDAAALGCFGGQKNIGLTYNRGEMNAAHKLTKEQVSQIRHLLKETRITKTELAKAYGVTDVLIGMIARRQIWRDVA